MPGPPRAVFCIAETWLANVPEQPMRWMVGTQGAVNHQRYVHGQRRAVPWGRSASRRQDRAKHLSRLPVLRGGARQANADEIVQ
jgi:hypothetical protein